MSAVSKKKTHNSPLVTQTLVYQGLSKSFDIFSQINNYNRINLFSHSLNTKNAFYLVEETIQGYE